MHYITVCRSSKDASRIYAFPCPNSYAHLKCRFLLSVDGMDPNMQDAYGNSPLHVAKNASVASALLAVPSLQVNSLNGKGETPLIACIANWKPDVASGLLDDERVRVDCRDQEGRTAMDWLKHFKRRKEAPWKMNEESIKSLIRKCKDRQNVRTYYASSLFATFRK